MAIMSEYTQAQFEYRRKWW